MKWGKGKIKYFRGGSLKCYFFKNQKHGKCIIEDRRGTKTEEMFKGEGYHKLETAYLCMVKKKDKENISHYI